MTRDWITRRAALAALAAALAAGCGGKKDAAVDVDAVAQRAELEEIWEAYSAFATQHKKPPAKLDDLKLFRKAYPSGVTAAQTGECVVAYGTPVGSGSAVLAYAKRVPDSGGVVLFADGTLKALTAQEFQAVKPAKGG